MAYLKVEHVHAHNKATRSSLKLSIYVSADGEFYCHVSDEYFIAAKGVFSYVRKDPDKGKMKLIAESLDQLTSRAAEMLRNHITPEVTEEHVIRYNIESHVSFATDHDGNICPNAGYDGAEWIHDDREKLYGNHDACRTSKGGYSLTIGAIAVTKTTYKYGDEEKVEYDKYYKGDSIHGHDNPAQKLNSWCSFRLPEDAKEIPYTDEAALFFHDMMMGMARLSQMIQSSTFDQAKLLNLIESGNGQLLLGGRK